MLFSHDYYTSHTISAHPEVWRGEVGSQKARTYLSPGNNSTSKQERGDLVPQKKDHWAIDFMVKKHPHSLVNTFQCHWCLEPNVILPGCDWDGGSATGQGHSQSVAHMGTLSFSLGRNQSSPQSWCPCAVTVVPMSREARSSQKASARKMGSEETVDQAAVLRLWSSLSRSYNKLLLLLGT